MYKQIQFKKTKKIIKFIYPECKEEFFYQSLNKFDREYITGEDRNDNSFTEKYIKERDEIRINVLKLYSIHLNFKEISPEEANNWKKSWSTVISGRRPMGQFGVVTLYSPILHILFELPNIGIKIFPKKSEEFLHIIVIYRKDCEIGEQYASRFIELYNKKMKMMEELEGDHSKKVNRSELAVSEEMGQLFYYSPEYISQYMKKLFDEDIILSSNEVSYQKFSVGSNSNATRKLN